MNNKGQWLIHITGCIIFLAFPVIFSPEAGSPSDLLKHPPPLKNFTVYILLILYFYFNCYWLIPQYHFNKRYARFFLLSFTCFTIIVLLPTLLIHGDDKPSPPAETGYYWPPNNPNPLPSQEMQEETPAARSFPLELIRHAFLFMAVFFFSFILTTGNRRRQTST